MKDTFLINISNKLLFKTKDILETDGQKTIILKNYDRENLNKTKEWRKILFKLKVSLKTGMLAKVV